MAYSDYGGYAFLNGERVIERSDAVLDEVYHTLPGSHPGISTVLQLENEGKTAAEIADILERRYEVPNGHVVLGDDTIYVGLYKQDVGGVWIDGVKYDVANLFKDYQKEKYLTNDGWFIPSYFVGEYYEDDYEGMGIVRTSGFVRALKLNFWLKDDRYELNLIWKYLDNLYVYARLKDTKVGSVWTGFSGYGVGAGLEDVKKEWGENAPNESTQDVIDDMNREFAE